MAWWDRPFGKLRTRAEPTANLSGGSLTERAEAWRDLPRLQRTLAEPLQPIAIGDGFRDSLASYADPSFLAPLSHQVDPLAGGLVDGLAAPGQPYTHAGGSELVVPARPASRPAPRVQRSVAWTGPTELSTVRWELPSLPDLGAETPSVDAEPELVADVPVAGPTSDEPAAISAPPASVSRPPVTPPSVMPLLTSAPMTTSTPPPPSVSNSSTPPRPVQRSVVDTTRPATPIADAFLPQVPGKSPSAVDDVPAAVLPPQAFSGSTDSPVTELAAVSQAMTEVATPAAPQRPDTARADALPVVSRVVAEIGSRTESGPRTVVQRAVDQRATSQPTLGPRLIEAPLATAPALLTRRTATAEPPVQRLEYLSPATPIAPTRQASAQHSPTPTPVTPSSAAFDPPVTSTPLAAAPSPSVHLASVVAPEVQRAVVTGPARTPSIPFEEPPTASDRSPMAVVTPAVQRVDTEYAESSLPAAVADAGTVAVDPGGPAVAAEPWVSQRSGPSPLGYVPSAPTPQAAASPSTYADPTPLVVSRQAVSSPAPPERPSAGMSFASMFGSAHVESGSAAEDGYTSVQLDAADVAPAPAPSDPVSAPAPTAAVPPAAGGAAPADLDEMARRLYEPLSARLRAELWLDRERAGVMSDV